MAESDLVDKLSEEESSPQNEENKKDEQQSYTQVFSKIISDFSDFLSKRSVYEAAPENSKVLVFNSDLSFKEMIKAFINEDIYCALIYDSKKEYFTGIITISDILFLFQYIIENAQKKKITDYNTFIKEIFSPNKILLSEDEDNKENTKDKNFDILKYLTKINYNDYFEVVKKYKKIHILYSISLDSSLLDVLKVIYKVGVHRLVVEETKKKGLNENKKKENEINLQSNIIENKIEKEEKEKNDKSAKDKSDIEKSDIEKSDKKIKKVKTQKKVTEKEEGKEKEKEGKEGEKTVKKKVKKIKKKKTETELSEKDKEKEKEKEENENKEEGEKVSKKKVKKVKKKKTVTDLNENDKEIKEKEKKEEEKKSEEKKETNHFQKSEKSIIDIDENSNKDVLKLNFINDETSKNLELPSETQNFTGFVTYETVFDFLIYNYYSMEMKEFNLTLEDLKKLPSKSSFIKPLTNFALMNEEVHSSFSKNITSKNDILPILTMDKSNIFGFLFLRDYLYFVSNCESNQNLTNEQFLCNMYEGIEDSGPYGMERIIFLEYNDEAKKFRIKELLEKINGAPEKKIVLKDIEDGNKLYIISLKNIFDVVVEMNENMN